MYLVENNTYIPSHILRIYFIIFKMNHIFVKEFSYVI